MILDTSFVVEILRNRADAIKKITQLEESNVFKISAITVFELELFVPEQKINRILSRFIIVPITESIARKAGQLFKDLKEKGLEIDKEDCLIAATALEEKDALLTKNIDHFKRIKSIELAD
jgi:predicted nucleic acid-binding protein